MCTCLGAAVVFSPRLVSLANKKFLASSLAGAAGVMIYVSFVEIFQKSLVRTLIRVAGPIWFCAQLYHAQAVPLTQVSTFSCLFQLLLSLLVSDFFCPHISDLSCYSFQSSSLIKFVSTVSPHSPLSPPTFAPFRVDLKTRVTRMKKPTCWRRCAFSPAFCSANFSIGWLTGCVKNDITQNRPV